MRVFVLTDIHGNNDLFNKALKDIAFDKADKLILLGDIIDRGDDSKGVLDTLLSLLNRGYDVSCLLGNHEKMFLDSFGDSNSLKLWLYNGGYKTLASFMTTSIDRIPKRYIDFIASFVYYHTYENYILVHAGLNMKIDNPFSDIETLLWERDSASMLDSKWLGNRKLIHGHTPIDNKSIQNSVKRNNKIINIDNGTHINKDGFGSICVFELNRNKINFVYENS